MRILLISPFPAKADGRTVMASVGWMPLGLASIGAMLRKHGHTVSIFDRFAEAFRCRGLKENVDRRMLNHLAEFRPDLVGLNTVSPLIYDTLFCAGLIRKCFDGLMIAGGHHVTAMPKLTLTRIPELDGVIAGEGEEALVRLIGGESVSSIPGVYWRKEDGISGLCPRFVDDLDRLPFPAVDLLDLPFYTKKRTTVGRGKRLSVLSLFTSRGCGHRCPFCSESMAQGNKIRFHSVDYVMDLLKHRLSTCPVNGFYVLDSDFLSDTDRAATLCENIIRAGLNRRASFIVQARVDRITPGILALLKRAGCVLVELGVESFVQKHLDFIGKGVTIRQNEEALRMLRTAGMAAHVYMMTGFPGETRADLGTCLERMKAVKGDVTFTLSPLTIDPGTRLYMEKGGRFFESKDWTADALWNYYAGSPLSGVSPEEYLVWKNLHVRPWMAANRRKAVFQRNSLFENITHIGRTVLRRGAKGIQTLTR